MSHRRRDGADRLLATATAGLPASRSEWGEAMLAELASIDDPIARKRFARGAARAAFVRGYGIRVGFGMLAAVLVAAIALAASRLQLADGGPGVLPVTVPVPALVLLLAALVSAGRTRSFRIGMQTGLVALVAGFAALFAVLAVEGMVWMDLHGVFLLDGDPPRGVADPADIVFDVFTTGMWVGYVISWLPAVVIGAALGTWVGDRRNLADIRRNAARRRDG